MTKWGCSWRLHCLLVKRQLGLPCLVGSLCLMRAKWNLGRSLLSPGVQLRMLMTCALGCLRAPKPHSQDHILSQSSSHSGPQSDLLKANIPRPGGVQSLLRIRNLKWPNFLSFSSPSPFQKKGVGGGRQVPGEAPGDTSYEPSHMVCCSYLPIGHQ